MKKIKSISAAGILFYLMFAPVNQLFAQDQTDFSGKWAFDISKSNPGDGSFGSENITHIIVQKPGSISIEEIIGEQKIDIGTFPLDGKEMKETVGSRAMKKSSAWSSDRKSLTLTNIMSIGGQDFRTDDTYKLSSKGQVLTVNSVTRDANGESTVVWVFNRKK